MEKEICHAYLGRFSPFHKYHEKMVGRLVEAYGSKNVLVMVGSSNSYNERTPYTFEERETMIHSIFPDIEVIPLPDGNPKAVFFDGSTNDIWLERLKKIESERGIKFVFYGGSAEDLKVLSLAFETKVLINRDNEGAGFSATKVREEMEKKNTKELEKYLNPKIISMAIAGYHKFNKQK